MFLSKSGYGIIIGLLILLLCGASSLVMYSSWQKANGLKQNQSTFENRLNRLESDVDTLKQKRVANITVTAYSPRTAETDSTPNITAFMTNVENRTIGLPWYLIQQGWTPKNCVYLNIPSPIYGGLYKINDRMNDRYQFRADIFFFSTEHAVEFGIFYNVDMVYLGECP